MAKMEKMQRGNERYPSADMQRESYEWNRMTNETVAKRAFELYLARGGQHGNDLGDWLQAERELGLDRQ
jgi:hypothetical protein